MHDMFGGAVYFWLQRRTVCTPQLLRLYVQARALMAAHAKPQIVRQLLVLVNELTNLGTATPPPDATQ